jgi:alpha-galactosidase
MNNQSTIPHEEHVANCDFLHRWLDALCHGIQDDRPVTLQGDTAMYRESLSFANRPLRIAGRRFESGLAMLTDSVVEVHSALPMTRFRAEVGLDDNAVARRMVLASVVFSVESDGRELWRSQPMGPTDGAQPVDIALDGLQHLTLRVTLVNEAARALRGYWAHADFAEATVELVDESTQPVARTLEERRLDAAVHPPLSFRIGGRTSTEFFETCWRDTAITELADGERRCTLRFHDDESGVTCRLEARQFAEFTAVEWIAYFSNESEGDSPVLEDVRALDLAWLASAPARLHAAKGSDERPDDFQPVVEDLSTIRSDFRTVRLESGDVGRSSISNLPFMNIETGDEGLVVAIGWTGQWSAEIGREPATGAIRVQAGMDGIHLRLQPGESIRTPRILLMPWQGEPIDGNNLLRRYLLAHCVPQVNGRPLEAPSCLATWGGQPTPQHQACISRLAEQDLKFDCYWVDAGWYGTATTPCPDVFSGEWWKCGDWRVNPLYHEGGLTPLSASIHAAGMKFLLWIDMESASQGVPLTREHPEWFLSRTSGPRQENDGLLLNLGHPEALAYAIETVSELIRNHGVDWYRQDFNLFRPIDCWNTHDAPDRQGITQIRHIEGLYAFWDELRRRFPDLLIDNCASGGRRIDLETLSRSIPLWRSDYGCFAEAEADGLQVHAAGLACWVPISSGGCVCPPGDTYYFRSNLSAALVEGGFCNDVSTFEAFLAGTDDYPWAWYRRMLDEYYSARPLFYGDVYPLTSITTLPDAWLAYQLHRPDLDQGLILAFRRAQSPHPDAVFRLKGLDPSQCYRFIDADSGQYYIFPAATLAETGLTVSLPEPRSCCLLFYAAVEDTQES